MATMPVIKKHDATAMDAILRTPVQRLTPRKSNSALQAAAARRKSLESPLASNNSHPMTPASPSVPTPSSTGANRRIDDSHALGTLGAAAVSSKRKRQSLGNSTVKALVDCCLSSHRKRARMSLGGTPGKANPMDQSRERDVAKRFLELDVTAVYKAIRKQTGALGGNAAGGAIYGEITQNSFQRVVDYMKEHCDLSETSLFLDVGSGLGKPNLHVAIDPGVEVSYGIELEELRWQLSLHNLKSVLQLDVAKSKPSRTMFTAGDITHAKSFNPFSHIYSFDVGFPPDVMEHMARIFNTSHAQYFASFHTPRKMIDLYGFAVENIGRVATTMAGSSEGHTCYFYRKVAVVDSPGIKRRRVSTSREAPAQEGDEGLLHIDPLFRPGFDVLSRGKDGVMAWIVSFFGEQHQGGRTRRQKRKVQAERPLQERPLQSYYRVVGKNRVKDKLHAILADDMQ